MLSVLFCLKVYARECKGNLQKKTHCFGDSSEHVVLSRQTKLTLKKAPLYIYVGKNEDIKFSNLYGMKVYGNFAKSLAKLHTYYTSQNLQAAAFLMLFSNIIRPYYVTNITETTSNQHLKGSDLIEK